MFMWICLGKRISRTKGYQCLLWLFFGVVLALGQVASAAPNMPGHIEVGKVTATTADVRVRAWYKKTEAVEGSRARFHDDGRGGRWWR